MNTCCDGPEIDIGYQTFLEVNMDFSTTNEIQLLKMWRGIQPPTIEAPCNVQDMWKAERMHRGRINNSNSTSKDNTINRIKRMMTMRKNKHTLQKNIHWVHIHKRKQLRIYIHTNTHTGILHKHTYRNSIFHSIFRWKKRLPCQTQS